MLSSLFSEMWWWLYLRVRNVNYEHSYLNLCVNGYDISTAGNTLTTEAKNTTEKRQETPFEE